MIDRLRAITGKRTAPGSWRTWHGDDDYAMNAYAVTSEPCDHEYTDDDGHHRHVIALTLLQHPRLASLGHTGSPDAMLWSENTAAIVAMDHTYEALLAVAEAAREYVELHDTMNYPETAAMYPARVRDALDALDARIAEVTK